MEIRPPAGTNRYVLTQTLVPGPPFQCDTVVEHWHRGKFKEGQRCPAASCNGKLRKV